MAVELTLSEKITLLESEITALKDLIQTEQENIKTLQRVISEESVKLEACQQAGILYSGSPQIEEDQQQLEEATNRLAQMEKELRAFTVYRDQLK